MVPAPPPLSRLRDSHSIDSAQKDSVPSLQEVAETFVCAPMTRPERLRPLPKDRQRPQTFLFGQSGIHQPVFARSPVLLSKPASRMLSMKRLRRWRDLQLLRWQSHLRGAFCHAFKTTNWSSKQTFIRSLLKEKRSRSCLTAEAECHHLGSSPYAPLAAPGLPLYPHRTERLRASLV